jgi:hypothetical protein
MRFSAACAVLAATLACAEPAAARWADWPVMSDADLEQIVRVAYTAAAAHARKNSNYFSRDDDTTSLRIAIEDELGRQGLTAATVAEKPFDDLEAASVCTKEGTELRFAVTIYGDAISLAAVSAKRVFSYHYDPHEDAAIKVAPAAACTKP